MSEIHMKAFYGISDNITARNLLACVLGELAV